MALAQLTFSQNGIEQSKTSEDISNVNNLMKDLNSDLKITPFEKTQIKDEYDKVTSSIETVRTLLENYGLSESDEAADIEETYRNLHDLLYVNGSAPLTDMTVTSAIDINTLRNTFITYYSQRDNIDAKIKGTINNNAATAKNEAATATQTADNANKAASSALSAANTAQQTANNVDSKASTALSTAQSAKTAADSALQAAQQKTVIYTQSSQPTNPNTNDIWFKTNPDGTIFGVYYWNGSSWIMKKLDYNSLSVGKLSSIASDLGQIYGGSLNINGNFIVDSLGNMTAKKGNFAGDITSKTVKVGSDNPNADYKQFLDYGYAPFLMQFNNPKADEMTGKYVYDSETFGISVFGNAFNLLKAKTDSNGVIIPSSVDEIVKGSAIFNTNAMVQAPYMKAEDYQLGGEDTIYPQGRITVTKDNDSAKTYRGYFQHDNGMKVTKYQSNTLAPLYASDVYLGSNRRRVPIIMTGKVSITPSGANTPTAKTILFGHTYSEAPEVFVTPYSTVPGKTVLGVSVNSIDATGCDIFVDRTNTTSTVVYWVAIGN